MMDFMIRTAAFFGKFSENLFKHCEILLKTFIYNFYDMG